MTDGVFLDQLRGPAVAAVDVWLDRMFTIEEVDPQTGDFIPRPATVEEAKTNLREAFMATDPRSLIGIDYMAYRRMFDLIQGISR